MSILWNSWTNGFINFKFKFTLSLSFVYFISLHLSYLDVLKINVEKTKSFLFNLEIFYSVQTF